MWFWQLLHIAYFVVFPILLLMAIGFAVQRRLGMDMPTLTRLNFYVVVPGMVYWALVSSELDGKDIATVVGFSLGAMAVWAVVTLVAAKVRRVPADQHRALLMSNIFFNAGNYGLPLQDLAFKTQGLGAAAMSLQVFVMIVQNVTSFTIGVLLAAGEMRQGQWKTNLIQIVKFPPIYALSAGLITIAVRDTAHSETLAHWAQPFWYVIVSARDGFIVVALVTLGAQLANVKRGGVRYPVTLSVVLRLLVAPAIGLGIIKLVGLEGFVAQVLLISTATPTSVNCMLLCLEFDNHPDFVARSVFYSTLLSPITVTLVIFLAHSGAI